MREPWRYAAGDEVGGDVTALDTELAAALAAVIDAENAAVYGYSVAGPRLGTAARRAAARSDYDVHRAQLIAVSGWLAHRSGGSDGTSAVAGPPVAIYSLPAAVTDDVSAATVLARLEEATAARYADVVAAAAGEATASMQRAAALALQSAAVREARWRGGSVPFPGLVNRLPVP